MPNSENPKRGSDFERIAQSFFASQGIELKRGFEVLVGWGERKKPHRFDLGSNRPAVLVECKLHTWTEGGNSPSAKLSVWNEAVLYFLAAPPEYHKVLFVLKSINNGVSLGQHYAKRFSHLVPEGLEIWEFSPESNSATRVALDD
jgi:hypothetical protein